MTAVRKTQGETALTPLTGLQLLGDDTAIGVCVDGVCTMPGIPAADSVAPKPD